MAEGGSEANVMTTEVLNTRSDRDLRWFAVLPNERVLFTLDYDLRSNTSQLRVYNTNINQLLSRLELPRGLSAELLDDQQVIVPLRETQQLQIINMDHGSLTKGQTFHINAAPWLVVKFNSSVLAQDEQHVLVLAKHDDDNWCFKTLNLTGNVKNNTQLSTNLTAPMSLKMSKDNKVVYVVDSMQGCYGVNLSGVEIFHYTRIHIHTHDINNVRYAGLAVDGDGDIYVSVGTPEEDRLVPKFVIKLSPAGQILTQMDIGLSQFQCYGNKLYGMDRNDQNEILIRYINLLTETTPEILLKADHS